MDLALRLCCNEITCRGDALLQEMKQYDIIKSRGVGFVWTKGTSTAEGITSENSEAPFYLIFFCMKTRLEEKNIVRAYLSEDCYRIGYFSHGLWPLIHWK